MFKALLFVASLMLCSLYISCDHSPKFSEWEEETFYVRNGGSDMPAFVRGNTASKTFVVYLEGGPGFGSLSVEGHPFANDLEKDYAMIYWDQRHTGNAHGHFNKEAININTLVQDLDALVKTIKLRYGDDSSIFLMGASWGGRLALSYLVTGQLQEDIQGWISVAGVNTDNDYKDRNEWVLNLAAEEINKGKQLEAWQEIVSYFSALDTINNLSPEERAVRQNYISQILHELIIDYIHPGTLLSRETSNAHDFRVNGWNFNNCPLSARDSLQQIYYGPEDLSIIKSPTLLIYGKYDFVVPGIQGQAIYDHLSSDSKYFKLYEHSGHGPMYTEAELFVSDVTSFIDLHK